MICVGLVFVILLVGFGSAWSFLARGKLFLGTLERRCYKNQIKLPLSILLLCGMISADEARAQVRGEILANNLRNNVVRVVAQFSDNPVQQNGFGFVVGERGGFVYIVTANHVVRGDLGDRVPIATGLFFFQDQGKEYRGDLLTTNLLRSEGDVAVVRVQTPPGFSWRHDVRTNVVPARGADVWFVGLSGNWYVPPRSGSISGVEPSGTIRFEGLSVRQGASGAPLIAETGILGMVVREGDIYGEATPIEVLERAFREWQYPWEITALSEPQPHRRVTTAPPTNVPTNETRRPPGVNCTGTGTPDEIEICRNTSLIDLDWQLHYVYEALLKRLDKSQQAKLAHEESAWVKQRGECISDDHCIIEKYTSRIRELQRTVFPTNVPTNEARGPSPGVNCTGTGTPDEIEICRNASLIDLDWQLYGIYEALLKRFVLQPGFETLGWAYLSGQL
jgi:uncharacterized protein